ncbi:AI-2E family transporter [Arcanobacterium hippocoleae]|uniref:AI-2E family transporter n=1 Tax=Arcanobacterium hippocoleae TaxID=149017 RepID=UPI003340B58B
MAESSENPTLQEISGNSQDASKLLAAKAAESAPRVVGTENDEHLDGRAPTGLMVLAIFSLLTISLAGFHYIESVFTPIFLALTLVLAFRPIGRALIKRGVPGWIAMLATFVTLIVVFIGIVSVTVWALTPVPETLLNYSGRFQETIDQAINFASQFGIKTKDFSNFLNDLNYNSLISWAWSLVDSLSSIGGLIAVVVISLFFITLDTVRLEVRSRVARKSHSNLAIALAGFEKRVRAYWIISTIFGLIVAIIDVFALQFIGIPLAWTWGMWAFITNYIPNIGFVIGVLPPMLMALLDQGWQAMIWVAVLYTVINVVFQSFIQPKFTGDVVGLSPSVTFISLIIWTVIVGLLGSILAVPLTLFMKALLIDSDPRTRWLDVYFVSEKDTRKEKLLAGMTLNMRRWKKKLQQRYQELRVRECRICRFSTGKDGHCTV